MPKQNGRTKIKGNHKSTMPKQIGRTKIKGNQKRYEMKHKEKIENLVPRNNASRTSLTVRKSTSIPNLVLRPLESVNPEYLKFMSNKVRLGGKGTQRRKKKISIGCRKGRAVKQNIKLSRKQLKCTPPIKYGKDECCVCYEKVKMSKENTIDCYGKTKALCLDCKGKMRKDVCPLCNNHSIGIKYPDDTSDEYDEYDEYREELREALRYLTDQQMRDTIADTSYSVFTRIY